VKVVDQHALDASVGGVLSCVSAFLVDIAWKPLFKLQFAHDPVPE
jgi:hypothetical protein